MGAVLTCWGLLPPAARTPAPGTGQPRTHHNLHSHLARVPGGLWVPEWGQEVQVGGQAVAEEVVVVVSGAAVSCRQARGQCSAGTENRGG